MVGRKVVKKTLNNLFIRKEKSKWKTHQPN